MLAYYARILAIIALSAAPSFAEPSHYFTAPSTQYHQLRSEVADRDFELLVVLPGSYEQSPDRLYPTLYLTDAQWDMALVASIVGKLNYDQALPEIVVVGITYPGADADYGKLRERELTPSRVEAVNPDSGGAGRFLRFIEEEAIPSIEARYRSDPERRALGGVSLGGLFTLYALYEKPELFGRFIAISPATVWDDGYIFRRDNAFAAEKRSLPARLFLTYGGGEYGPYRQPIARFQEKLAGRSYEGLELLNWQVEGERHGGVAVEGWIRGLRWAFQDIAPKAPDPLETLYKSIGREPRIVE